MPTIWKFEVNPWMARLVMPTGAKPIHAHEQGGGVCIWATIPDKDAADVEHRVLAVATGGTVPPEHQYVGTAHLTQDGFPLVFHVFWGGE